jgi:NAD(P)H-nitrite reductase large subunit
MKYRPDDFYAVNGCQTLLGKQAVKIDAQAKTVRLSDGEVVAYDKLMVATGSSPFVPPFAGLENVQNKFTFMTLDDALALEEAVDKDKRVLIIGAGLIGLKCAEGLLERAKSVTVTDLAPRVLSSILDEDCGKAVKAHISSKGINLLLGDSVKEFLPDRAIMQSGAVIDFDILVVAVGVRPNVSLVKDAGGEVNRGILTDEHMKTSLNDVYAAGDCTESLDITSGQHKILAILPNAYYQGECAGVNMAGGEKSQKTGIPMNAIGFFGLHMVTAGTYSGEVYEEREGENIKKLFFEDNRLKGYILIGDVDKAGIYTSLIRNCTPLDEIDFELVKKRPTLLAFQQDFRKKNLGGVV